MGSKFPADIQELLWKLHWCREKSVELGFDAAGLLIRSAAQEVEELAQLRGAAKKRTPTGDSITE